MSKTPSIELEFSKKYNHEHAQQYLHKHQNGLAHRLSHWRDLQLAHQALQRAGNPSLVFDLPYGAGRFWPLLAKNPNRVILAADSSEAMLETALVSQPSHNNLQQLARHSPGMPIQDWVYFLECYNQLFQSCSATPFYPPEIMFNKA